jgi:hypothetical protein
VDLPCAEKRPFAKALPGQVATLRARCQPAGGVGTWVIVKAAGDPPAAFPAQELFDLATSDPPALAARLKDRYVILTGEVTEVTPDGHGVILTAPDKRPRVTCLFNPESPTVKERARPHQVGDKVKILAQPFMGLSFLSCEDLGGAP